MRPIPEDIGQIKALREAWGLGGLHNSALYVIAQLLFDVSGQLATLGPNPTKERLQVRDQNMMEQLLLGNPAVVGELFVARCDQYRVGARASRVPALTSALNSAPLIEIRR